MLETLTRPSFFPGQLLDYRDFNRLAEQAEKTATLFNHGLFPQGGILLRSGKEFETTLGDGLCVIIHPGVAVLPNGETVTLEKEEVIDLAAYRVKGKPQTLIVGIGHETAARDHYTDPEDASIQGFRTVFKAPKLIARFEKLEEGCLELFRTVLSPQARSLRPPTALEEWSAGGLAPSEGVAVVDCRFRRKIVPLSYSPLGFSQMIELRTALYAMEDAHRRLQKIFLLEDAFDCGIRLTHLHAEILTVPFQPVKAAFVLSDFAEKMALFLESISRKCSQGQANFDREKYLRLCSLLDLARPRAALPQALPLDLLKEISALLTEFTLFAEQRFTLLNAVEEALGDLSDRSVDFAELTTLAGHVFERVDRLEAQDKDRVSYAAAGQVRKLQTRYRSGDAATRTGVFMREGKVSIDFQVPNPEAPVVVWLPQHVRRRGAKLEYRINGKSLFSEAQTSGGADNIWRNRGLVIAPEALVAQGNRLTIRVEEADLEYGFFEMSVYQPIKQVGAA